MRSMQMQPYLTINHPENNTVIYNNDYTCDWLNVKWQGLTTKGEAVSQATDARRRYNGALNLQGAWMGMCDWRGHLNPVLLGGSLNVKCRVQSLENPLIALKIQAVAFNKEEISHISTSEHQQTSVRNFHKIRINNHIYVCWW